MNGTSGFQEARPSTPRSTANLLLHEQQHQSGNSSCAISLNKMPMR
jgi:hypothetical protein